MATWIAVNAKVTKKLKQVEGVGITPGNINFSIEFFAEILKNGLFHHNYSGSMGVPSDGDFQTALTKNIQGHLRMWANADGIEDNAELSLQGVISVLEIDPTIDVFNKALANVLLLKLLVDAGIVSSDDAAFTAAIVETQKAYKAKIDIASVIVAEPPVQ